MSRLVQNARKRDEDLVITDRIEVWIDAASRVSSAVEAHRAYIAEQVLATSLEVGAAPAGVTAHAGKADGDPVTVALRRAPTLSPAVLGLEPARPRVRHPHNPWFVVLG